MKSVLNLEDFRYNSVQNLLFSRLQYQILAVLLCSRQRTSSLTYLHRMYQYRHLCYG